MKKALTISIIRKLDLALVVQTIKHFCLSVRSLPTCRTATITEFRGKKVVNKTDYHYVHCKVKRIRAIKSPLYFMHRGRGSDLPYHGLTKRGDNYSCLGPQNCIALLQSLIKAEMDRYSISFSPEYWRNVLQVMYNNYPERVTECYEKAKLSLPQTLQKLRAQALLQQEHRNVCASKSIDLYALRYAVCHATQQKIKMQLLPIVQKHYQSAQIQDLSISLHCEDRMKSELARFAERTTNIKLTDVYEIVKQHQNITQEEFYDAMMNSKELEARKLAIRAGGDKYVTLGLLDAEITVRRCAKLVKDGQLGVDYIKHLD